MGEELVGTIILSDGRAEFEPRHLLLSLAVGSPGTQPLVLLEGNPGQIPCACSPDQVPCVYDR